MSVDDIVDMVAVRNCVMRTRSAVSMGCVVSGARMARRAAGRIPLACAQNVLVDVSVVDMMQVSVVKIVLVAFVFDGRVPAVGPVLMIVLFVYPVIRLHRSLRRPSWLDALSSFVWGRVPLAYGSTMGVSPSIRSPRPSMRIGVSWKTPTSRSSASVQTATTKAAARSLPGPGIVAGRTMLMSVSASFVIARCARTDSGDCEGRVSKHVTGRHHFRKNATRPARPGRRCAEGSGVSAVRPVDFLRKSRRTQGKAAGRCPPNEHDAEEVAAVFLDAMNGTRHRLDAHPWREWILRGFIRVEDAVYVGLGTVLAAMALALLVAVAIAFAQALLADALPGHAVQLLDRLLLILMIVEILYTVQVSFSEHALVPEPFLIVGLIATIRRLLVLTAEFARLVESNTAAFRAAMLELGLLTVMIVALVVSLVVLKGRAPHAS